MGKPRPSCYDLPADGFAYGQPAEPDVEGAREVTMQWVSHKATPRADDSRQDFRRLNKLAIGEKACTAPAVAKHRRKVNLPLSARSTYSGPGPKVIPSDVVVGFTYGKKTRPSTPIGSVVSYQFSAEFEEDIGNMYEKHKKEKEIAAQIRKIHLTKAAKGHASYASKKNVAETTAPPDMFKITKFKKIQCKVEFPGGKTSEMKRLAAEPVDMPEEVQEGQEAQEAAQV